MYEGGDVAGSRVVFMNRERVRDGAFLTSRCQVVLRAGPETAAPDNGVICFLKVDSGGGLH